MNTNPHRDELDNKRWCSNEGDLNIPIRTQESVSYTSTTLYFCFTLFHPPGIFVIDKSNYPAVGPV